MANLAELMVKVGADISEFTKQMSQVQKDMNGLGQSMQNTGKTIGGIGSSLTASITTPLLAVGAGAVIVGAKFDKQMSKVQAISGATGDEFKALREQAIELGSSTAHSSSQVAFGMEQLASAGFTVDQIMSALPGVLDMASASGIDLATASEITGSAINGFGLEASDAGRVSDVLAKSAAISAADVQGLGEAFKYVAPVAGAMGLSIEEVSSAIGIMSDAGIKGSQAGTTLRMGILRLASPTEEMSKIMDKTGSAFFDAEGKMKSMEGIVTELQTATKDMTDEQKANYLATLFGAEAVSGFMALIEAGPDKLAKNTKALKDSNGEAKRMADTMMNNLAGSWEEFTGAVEALAISFSDVLAPTLRSITDWLTKLVNKFNELSPQAKGMIVIGALIAGALGPALIVIGLVAQGVGALVTVFGLVSAPVLAVIAGIALLVGAFVLAYAKIEPFREFINQTFTAIKEKVMEAINAVVTFLKEKLDMIKGFWEENGAQILQAVQNVWNFIQPIISIAMQGVLLVIEYVWNAIKGVINGALNIIMGLVKIFAGLFTGDFSKMWEGVKQLFMGAIEFVWNLMNLSFVGTIKNLVKNFVKWIVKAIKGKWDDIVLKFMYGKDKAVSIMNSVKDFLVKVWGAIKDGVVKVAKALWDGVKNTFNAMKDGITTIWNGIKSTASSIWNAIKSGIKGIVDGIKSVVTTVWNAISSTTSTVFNAIKSTATTVWNGIKTSIKTVVDGIKSTVTSVWEGIKSSTSTVFNGIKSTATTVWNGVKDAITKPIETAKKTVLGIIDSIKGAFSKMKITIPKPRLPKITVNMKKKMGVPYPDFDVSWNAKGNIFNGASILGGGQGVGEAGAEAVLPIQHKRYMQPFARAIASNMNDMKGNNDQKVVVENVVHTTIELDGEIVGRKVERYVSTEQHSRLQRTRRQGGR